jgi:hypothetical protein
MTIIPIIPLRTWSASRLKTFEQCKLRAQLAYGQKIPEPERPLPPGKSEHANDRGQRIHDGAERYVNGSGPFLPELAKFRPEFESLRTLYAEGRASLEGEWGMDRDWAPVGYFDPAVWLRAKLDAIVFLSPQEAVVIDYKSGKRFGNELAHAEQTQLYQLVTFLRYPQLELVHTELWYLDVDDLAHALFTRRQGLRLLPAFSRRGAAVTDATAFPPSPNVFSCKWCPYGPRGTGHCDKGV